MIFKKICGVVGESLHGFINSTEGNTTKKIAMSRSQSDVVIKETEQISFNFH